VTTLPEIMANLDKYEGDKMTHASIAKALATAQANMGKALKDTSNPHFKSKYADLSSVMAACMPALNAAGIAVIQPMRTDEMGGRHVVTIFLHESGEALECPVPIILGKNDMQGLGSAITYARRYGLMSLAGIAPEDDDGNAAAQNAQRGNEAADPKSPTYWSDTVIAELPAGSTPAEKSRAVREALIAQFQRKKSAGELNNEWARREKDIERLERFPADLEAVQEAFSMCIAKFADGEAA
jgi:hypothetical protein